MVGIVGDIECGQFTPFPFPFAVFGVGEFQAAVFHAVVAFNGLFAIIFQCCFLHTVTVGHRQFERVTRLPF